MGEKQQKNTIGNKFVKDHLKKEQIYIGTLEKEVIKLHKNSPYICSDCANSGKEHSYQVKTKK